MHSSTGSEDLPMVLVFEAKNDSTPLSNVCETFVNFMKDGGARSCEGNVGKSAFVMGENR